MPTKRIYTLALDAMGGDNAPFAVIEGANIYATKLAKKANRQNRVKFLFYGNRELISPILKKYKALTNISKIIHTPEYISSSEKPSIALRKGTKSSMSLAIKAVKDKHADAIVSSGNTGALMAISKISFRTLEGVDRPAIGTIMPTERSSSILLDMGANVDCSGENLLQFAIMGDAFARAVLKLDKPSIGLLNIGTEESKGNETVRSAHKLLAAQQEYIHYHGYVEGNDIMKGTVDVIVTDGFSGNIALKSIEGAAKMVTKIFKEGFKASIFAKIGLLFCFFSIKKMGRKIDPRNHNGAMFLGLNGISIKSHGNSDGKGFANAIEVAVNLIANKINDKIIEELKLSKKAND